MKIALLGDIGLFGKYTLKNPEIFNYFKEVTNVLKNVDYVVGNLEVPLCNETKSYSHKSAHLKGNLEDVQLLKYLNVSCVSLANNHIYDYGKKGYEETIEVLKENKIAFFGIEDKIKYLEFEENKIAFSGFCCYSANALGYLEKNKKRGVNPLKYDEVEKVILENKSKGYFNIASFHIGEEHVHYPNLDHINFGRKLSEKIEYIFYGHHPHVLQGIEEYKSSLLAYSLGNFCFDDVYSKKSQTPLVKQSKENKESCILILEIEKNKLKGYEVIPIFDDGSKIRVGNNNELLKKIELYSSYLKLNEKIFKNERDKIISTYISSRKSKRDFKWYLKRLNFGSVLFLKNVKSNSKNYYNCFKSKI